MRLFQKLRIKIFRSHQDLCFQREKKGGGEPAALQAISEGRLELGKKGGGLNRKSWSPQDLPNTPSALSFTICHHTQLNHRNLLAVAAESTVDIRKERSSRKRKWQQ